MSEWKNVLLTEVTSRIGDGLHGTPKYDEYGDYYFINGNNLISGQIRIKPDTKRVSEDEYLKYIKPISNDTILLSINGTIGNLAFYRGEKCILGKSACYINVNEKVDRKFMYYLFCSKDFQNYIRETATGTTIPNVPLKGIRDFSFNLPPIYEQEEIAEVLSSLDDKIELLQCQNNTLEQMAESLFKKWFDESDYSSSIYDLIELQNGYAFKSKSFQDFGEQRVLKIKNISGGIVDIEKSDFVSDETIGSIDKKFVIKTGDILFAMTGAKIGKMGIIPKTESSLWLNQRVGLFKEKYKGSRFLAYLHLKSEYGVDYIENTATGSAQPNISGTGIENCEFPSISKEQIIDYSEQLSSFYDKIIFNLGQIKTLEKLRDTLLPKLMNGEIDLLDK